MSFGPFAGGVFAVRWATITFSTVGISGSASSTLVFSGTAAPFRHPPSEVITTFAPASFIRSRSASAEKPPNTTECTAPIRAQASMAMATSGIIGR